MSLSPSVPRAVERRASDEQGEGNWVGRLVVELWNRVLGKEAADGDFFGLGGGGLEAAELLSVTEDAFDVTIPMATFLEDPTVSGLTKAVHQAMSSSRATGSRHASPVAFSQEGMLWHEQFAPGSFNLPPFVRRYQGNLDVVALRDALSDVVARHAALRTTFVISGGRPRQQVRPPERLSVPITDLTGWDPDGQRQEVARVVADAAQRPFELSKDALFEPQLLRLGEDEHVLIIRLHHLVFDDWSVNVFRRDLSALYRARVTGTHAALPELRTDFLQVCSERRRAVAGRVGGDELAWWRQELAGAPLTVNLAVNDPSRPPGSPHRAAPTVSFPLPVGVVQAFRGLAREERTTLFAAMLAVFAVLVAQATGQDDLVLASVVANRATTAVEPLIGCFTKKILVRIRLSGDPTFREMLRRVRTSLLGAMAHQELSYETVLQETLGSAAAIHGLVPDISVMFQAEVQHKDTLSLPGLELSAFDTGTSVEQPHFAAEEDNGSAAGALVWGSGLYRNTFLIASLNETADGVSLITRGAYDPPAVEALIARLGEIAAELAARPDGRLSEFGAIGPVDSRAGEVAGRVSASIDLRGYLVDPARISSVLRHHPEVQDAVVVADGEHENRRLVAYVALSEAGGQNLTLAGVRSYLWSRLPGYAWPASLVPLPRLPTLPNGDIDVSALPSAPLADTRESETLTDDECSLARLWGEVLNVAPVDIDANYWQKFSFIDAVAAAERAGLPIRRDQVRRNRTLRTLAADVTSGRDPGVPEPPTDPQPRPSSDREEVIRAVGLTKNYPGGRAAVDNLDLSLVAGEILAVLGPNGAGKTTTVGMLTGKVIPTGGRAFVKGIDVVAYPAATKQHIGLVQQGNTLDRGLNVWENLYFHARYFGMGSKEAEVATNNVLERLHLVGREHAEVHSLSGGFVRRVMLARAILHRPAVLFLDEPTAGLDPQTRLALWEILEELRSQGQSIFMTTHYMEEADQLSDRVAIMDHGHILALDTAAGLKTSLGHGATVTVKADGDLARLVAGLRAIPGASEVQADDGGIRLRLTTAANVLVAVMAAADDASCRLTDVSLLEDTLENVFINLTGRDLRE